MQNYFTQIFSGRHILKSSALAFLAAALAILAGCGSGQAIPTVPLSTAAATTTTGAPVIPPAATLQLLASASQMPSAVGTTAATATAATTAGTGATGTAAATPATTAASLGTSTIDLVVIALSATKETVAGKTVKFSTIPTETAFISEISNGGVTDAKGMVTAKLFLGADRSNRTIVVTATTDSAIATNSIEVIGTTINISGVQSLAFGAQSKFTITLKDSSEKPIAGITLKVTSKTGNTITLTPDTGITNSAGEITALVKATAAGADAITAEGAGATKILNLDVSSASFAFTVPVAAVEPATTDIPLNTAQAVSVKWTEAGVPQVGKLVSFATTRGALAGVNPATTDANGVASGITVSSASSGPAFISATGAGGSPAANVAVEFVAKSASNVTAQSVPGTIQFTTGVASQTSNSSTISAVVRDSLNNLVKSAAVDFNVYEDPSGGSLSAARAITDSSGTAKVTYKAGNTSSAQNGVKIRATVSEIAGVPIAAVNGTTALTVSGQSVLVRIGSDNLATSNSPVSPTYSKTYAAIVTDTAGNPVAGTDVHFALRPGQYRKGQWVIRQAVKNGTLTFFWAQIVSTTCPNEDRNFNGFLDTVPAPGQSTTPIDIENQQQRFQAYGITPIAIALFNPAAIIYARDAQGNKVSTDFAANLSATGTAVTTDPTVTNPANPASRYILDAAKVNVIGEFLLDGENKQILFQNGFGALQPGMPASVNTTGKTDANGVAVATVTYPKNHAYWTEVILEARAGVTSNDPPAYTTFFLSGLSTDYSNSDVEVPGRFSPWGVGDNGLGDATAIPAITATGINNATCGNLL